MDSRQAVPRPQPDAHKHKPTEDEFAAWCEHPVTRYVAAAYEAAAKAQGATWMAESWVGEGEASPERRATLKARADAYNAFLQTRLENYERFLTA